MVVAWVLTMPAAALVGAGAEETVSLFGNDTAGVVFVAIVAAGVLGWIFALSRRSAVTADNVIDEVANDPDPVAPALVTA
jgi:PiT family inorganic phosphate transporter